MMSIFNDAAVAQPVAVTLDVPDRIISSGDRLEIRGTYSKPHSWDSGQELTRSGSGAWAGQIAAGRTPFEYKYVIVRANGQLEWESGGNRLFDGAAQIKDRIRGFDGEYLHQPVTVHFILDLNGYRVNGEPVGQVAVMGERGSLSWDLPEGATLMAGREGDTWDASIVFPQGMPVDVPFKFAWQSEGVWHWESLPGHIDHLLILDADGSSASATYRYNPEAGRIEPAGGAGAVLDDYELANRTYGQARRYGYMHAIDLLGAGKAAEARQVYDSHRRHYEPVDIDDFDFLWAHDMAENGRLEEALAFAAQQGENETIPWRKAYFRYLQGELLLNEGRHEEAIPHLEQALEEAPDDDPERLVEGYAHLGLAAGYRNHADASDKRRARVHLMALATNHPDEQMQRLALTNLAGISREAGDEQGVERALERLTRTGSLPQRSRSKLDRLEHLMDRMPPDSVAFELQWLEATIDGEGPGQRLKLLKAAHLIELGKQAEAEELLRQVEARKEFARTSGRAKARLDELKNRGGN